MASFGRQRRRAEEDTDLNMVPIMNMFMVLIPFLLMSASFLHIKAINTSVPVHANSAPKKESAVPEVKVTVILSMHEESLDLSAMSDALTVSQLTTLETTIPRTSDSERGRNALAKALREIKTKYPLSDTMVLVPDATVLYDDIIRTMDVARNHEEITLFPNVVLSGSLG